MGDTYSTLPKLHRDGVTSIDSADPADTSGAIDSKGYGKCRFDVTIAGVDFTSLETQVIFWNPRQENWWSGGKRIFTSTGRHALMVDCRGAIIFLKVTAFSGTSFALSADYILS